MAESAIKYKVETLATGLGFPHGIALHKDGTIYVADQNHNRLIKIKKVNGEYCIFEVHPEFDFSRKMLLDFPGGLLWDKEGKLLIANTTYKKIEFIDLDQNKVVRAIGPSIPKRNSSEMYQLEQPRSLAFDNQGNLLVVNCGKQQIAKIDIKTGECIAQGTLSLECALPQGIVVDADNRIIFANRNKHTIHVMDCETLMEIGILAGTGKEGHKDGPIHQALFTSPTGVALDSIGNIYISDYKAIRKIDRMKDNVSTVLTGLDFPLCMIFDNQGNMLFTEYVGHSVKRILLNQRTPWKVEKVLWIGNKKNSALTCPFACLPKEIVKEIISFCSGNIWE